MNKQCETCKHHFSVTEEDLAFYRRVSPIADAPELKIPAPRLCPQCRTQRRYAFRNERKLYSRTCDSSGKKIISVYSADKPFPVYESSLWWGDSWSPLDYGREFDFNRSFTEQFAELLQVVPKLALVSSNNENSEYINYALNCKNCYLVLGWGEDCEDCLYGRRLLRCNTCIDVSQGLRCECCYECSDIENCYELFYSDACKNCNTSYYLRNCIGCSNCFGCINLNNQKYCIYNEQYTKVEYERALNRLLKEKMQTDSARRALGAEIRKRFAKHPHKFYTGINNQDSLGDYLYNCKNALHSYDTTGAEDVRYIYEGTVLNNCMDLSAAGENNTEFAYECVSYTGKNGLFLNLSWFCNDLAYCNECIHGCSDCFACVGLRRSKYCILNKEYSEKQYKELLPKIIKHMQDTGEWGEFFSPELSPFGYNETVACEYFPLEKQEALTLGFNWSDYEAPEPQANQHSTAQCCLRSRKQFRLTKFEKEFYRTHDIPIPEHHPDERHALRLALRNPRKLWERNCDKCKTSLQSSYEPGRPEPILCEPCFHAQL